MATKNKKKTVKVLPFNKQNILNLADTIYSDKFGQLSVLKLCEGNLRNGKDGGRTTHCAVGEAYFTFVNPNMTNILKKKDYESDYGLSCEGETAVAIDALVKVAVLKKDTEGNREKLAFALDEAVNENDDDTGVDGIAAYVERSKRVADVFRKQVAPLLK